MKHLVRTAVLFLVLVFLSQCQKDQKNDISYEFHLRNTHHMLNAAIIEDGFSPPVASRIYANTYLAAYECIAIADENYPDLAGALNNFPEGMDAIIIDDQQYIPEAAALRAMIKVAKALVYRKFILEEYEAKLVQQILDEGNASDLEYSFAKGNEIADLILTYCSSDNYKETRNMPFHSSTNEWGTWEPTPPMYGTAIEPHWSKIRPFVLDSVEAFKTNYPLNYDTARNSEFFEEALIVYEAVKNLDAEQTAKANHWDCNPRETLTSGHMVTQIKQMNPGGHWLGIAHTVLKQQGADFRKTVYACAYTTLAVSDGFVVCWDEKYQTNLIRPETFINRYIDPDWQPILETPLFPEYTSGHSVVSGISSTMLTHLVGDNIAFVDSVNFMFNLPPRNFESFNKAAEEAAISRLYGGIHYMPAVENGLVQGRSIANYILDQLPLKP